MPSRRVLRLVLALLALGVLPLTVLEIHRRSVALAEKNRDRHREATAIVVSSLAALRRTAHDWGHWDDMYAFVTGNKPTFVDTDIATTSLFDDGGVLVLLDPEDRTLLVFSHAGKGHPNDQPLAECVRRNVQHLGPSVGSSMRLACTNGKGEWLLGVATPISNNASTAPRHGTLVMFEPLLRPEYGDQISRRLIDMGRHLIPFSRGQSEHIQPSVRGPAGTELAVAASSTRSELIRSLLVDLLRLLAVVLMILAIRGLLLLERRRQILGRRLAERRTNHRIRHATWELDRLLARTGLDPSAPEADQRLMARLLDPQPALPGRPEPGLERQLELLAGRFQHFLQGARSLALFDPLTQLPNRRYFIEHLELQAEKGAAGPYRYVILFIDIDRFKSINDTYGHAIGDALLVVVADRLRSRMRKSDFLARYGGDEFAMLVKQSGNERADKDSARAAAYSLASRIATEFEVPVHLPGVELELSISIGIDLESLEAGKAEQTMKRCDIAMSRAKQHKHTRIAIFDMAEGAAPIENYRLYVDLIQAVRDHSLEVVFQPIVARDGLISGVEALARWQHPELGFISPELFLDVAERHRQMLVVGNELLQVSVDRFAELSEAVTAAAQAAPGQQDAQEVTLPGLSLNIAPSMLSDPEFVDRLQKLLAGRKIPPTRLTIELTERSMLESNPVASANLDALRTLGIRLSLDDFGTGYSSLHLLSSLHPDEVKIDKSFVMAMRTDDLARQIVTMVSGMAPSMGLEVVAEGVDNLITLSELESLGIHRFQGFLFSRGVPVAALLERCTSTPSGLQLSSATWSSDPAIGAMDGALIASAAEAAQGQGSLPPASDVQFG